MQQQITPLDPNSPKGREVTTRLAETLAAIRLEIAHREGRPQPTNPDNDGWPPGHPHPGGPPPGPRALAGSRR